MLKPPFPAAPVDANPYRLPWKRLAGCVLNCDMKQVSSVYQRDDRGEYILGDVKDEANAEFSVAAVNNHEALLGECERFLQLFEGRPPERAGEITQTPDGIAQLRSVVARARAAAV